MSKATLGVISSLCRGLRDGNSRTVSCLRAGITIRTLQRWIQRAEDGEQKYVEIRDQVEQAEALSAQNAVELILKAGHKDWRAAAWFLERRFPDDWGAWRAKLVPGESNQLVNFVVEVGGSGASSSSPE